MGDEHEEKEKGGGEIHNSPRVVGASEKGDIVGRADLGLRE